METRDARAGDSRETRRGRGLFGDEDIDGAARVWSVTPSKGKEREKGEGKTEVRGSRGWTEEEEEAKEGGARRRTAVASGGAVVGPPCVGTERDRWGERRKPGEESRMRSGSQLYI